MNVIWLFKGETKMRKDNCRKLGHKLWGKGNSKLVWKIRLTKDCTRKLWNKRNLIIIRQTTAIILKILQNKCVKSKLSALGTESSRKENSLCSLGNWHWLLDTWMIRTTRSPCFKWHLARSSRSTTSSSWMWMPSKFRWQQRAQWMFHIVHTNKHKYTCLQNKVKTTCWRLQATKYSLRKVSWHKHKLTMLEHFAPGMSPILALDHR